MAEPKTIRILAVDDHEMVRKGIRFTLLSVNDIEMIGEAMSGEEALEICDQEAPDVVIMDMMLVGDGRGCFHSSHTGPSSPDPGVGAIQLLRSPPGAGRHAGGSSWFSGKGQFWSRAGGSDSSGI